MEEYLPQVQLLFLFSLEQDAPAYFRILPGSINSVMSLKVTMEETGAMKIVLDLEAMKIFFIIPLKRNSKLIDYSIVEEKHFMFQDRPVFYSKYHGGGRTVYTFRNDFLRAEEEKDYLERHKDGSASAFRKAMERMGTISIVTNLKVPDEIVYDLLKKHDLLRRYSPEDVLERANMLRIGEEWRMSEIPEKSRDIIDALEIPIMQKGGS